MTGRLAGKTALVTAAGQGIGRATALAFAREGASVVASDREVGLVEELARGSARVRAAHVGERIRAVELDVRDAAAVERVVGDCGALDVLFNCAGWVHQGTILECRPDDWQASFDVNVSGMYRTIRAALPGMIARRRGSIVNMASVASSVKGVAARCAYSASKAAVIGLTKSVAADYVALGIRCNAVCPGTVDTPSLAERVAAVAGAGGGVEAVRAAFVARQPMGRLGTAEEIAQLVVYLAADESSFTTGAIHVIDGGWTG